MSLTEDFADIAARLNQIERDHQIEAIKDTDKQPAAVTAEDDTKWIDFGPYCC